MEMSKLSDALIENFCTRFASQHQLLPIGAKWIKLLIKVGLINRVLLRNYMILGDYPMFLANNNGHVMDAIYQMSDKYQLSERQIQNIIYQNKGK
jgi:hypothetical protein